MVARRSAAPNRFGAKAAVLAIMRLSAVAIPSGPVNAETPAGGTWATWTKADKPVFEGQFIASDPAVILDGRLYRMAYTCFVLDLSAAFDPETTRVGICEAVSTDGLSWRALPAVDGIEGLVSPGREGSWAEHLEASFMVKRGGEYLLHYSGYRHKGLPAQGFPAALAVSRSTDGVHFEPVPDRPILPPTPGWHDNDAVYSPTIVERGGELVMVYAGHCYTRCDSGSGVTLLAATSPDGLVWTKRAEPVLTARSGVGWTRDGVAEPALLLGPDGAWQLFFVGLLDAHGPNGVARGPTPFGPWDVDPVPVVVPSTDGFDRAETLAPHVRLEGAIMRMWFLGQTPEEDIAIGYAKAPWPLWTR